MLMMNMRNLGSKESFGVKFTYAPNCVESYVCLKATGIFVVLLSQDAFKSDCPETNFQTISS